MEFRMPEGVEEFRQEVRAFIDREWHPDPAWAADSPEMLEAVFAFRRKLGPTGWLNMLLPKECGGRELPPFYQYVFHDEMSLRDAPFPRTAVNIVAPTLVRVGSEEQKKRYLPLITSGEVEFCLGYTEPGAGSDLASLEIRAVEDGDDFVVTGNKVFTLSRYRTNRVYYDDVRVPKGNLVGEMNQGWYHMTTALNFERVSVSPIGTSRHIFETIVKYVKETTLDGKPLKDDPEIQDKIGRLSADLEMHQLLSWRTAWLISKGIVPSYESSMNKVSGSELLQRVSQLGTQIMGLYGQLQTGSKYVPVGGYVEHAHRLHVMQTIGGGSNEMQRNTIAIRGLGLPR